MRSTHPPLIVLCLVATSCGGDDDAGTASNSPPALSGPASVALMQGRATQTTLTATDPDGDAITATAAAPAGIEASIDAALVLDAYADYAVSGGQNIALTLTDARGASSDASLTAEVAPLRWLERTEWTNNGPSPREHAAPVVDVAGGRVLLFGGSGYAPQGTPLGDNWQYDLRAKTWSALTATGDVPAAAGSRRVAQVPGESVAYLFGGYAAGLQPLDDLYRVDFSGGGAALTKLAQTNPPPPRSLHGFAYDAETKRLFAFAGVGDAVVQNQVLGDLWTATISGDTATWTEVLPNVGPSPRYGVFFGVDESAGRLILFSGVASLAPPLSPARDTWSLDLRATPPVWTLLAEGDSVPPGRRNGCFVMDPAGQRLFVWGGTAEGATSEKSLFAFDARPGKERWSTLDLADEPPLRSSGLAIYDPTADQLLFGFGNDAGLYRDFTTLGY